MKPTVRLRVIGLVVVGVAATVIALLIPDHYLGSFNSFVLLMLYFLVPWTAVNLVDFYFVRRGKYAIAEILKPEWHLRSLGMARRIAYPSVSSSMIPFFSLSFFVGPVAASARRRGLLVRDRSGRFGGLYLVLSRSIDADAERQAVQRSWGRARGDRAVTDMSVVIVQQPPAVLFPCAVGAGGLADVVTAQARVRRAEVGWCFPRRG